MQPNTRNLVLLPNKNDKNAPTIMKKLLIAALACLATAGTWASTRSGIAAPQFLKPGDKIAVISPGSTPGAVNLDKGVDVLRQWGFNPVKGRHVTDAYHLWAGKNEDREADLLWALRDPAVKAIMCSRGGYGSSQLLYDLPIDTIKKYNKWIIGYSDITALHSAQVRAGHMSLHANMCGHLGETGGTDSLSLVLRDLLLGKVPSYKVKGHPYNNPGKARGILVGGNLSVMVNISGSKTYDFLDRCRAARIKVPITFGIMPIMSKSQVSRMVFLCGASLPAPLVKLLARVIGLVEQNQLYKKIMANMNLFLMEIPIGCFHMVIRAVYTGY